MVVLETILHKFGKKGEKTGWTYAEIPSEIAQILKADTKVSFRVKGRIDSFEIKLVALVPMGEGVFILPINADMRRGIHKKEGAMVRLELTEDTDPLPQSDDLLDCIADDPRAQAYFEKLPLSHQNYYFKWIESAKTPETKAKRIARTVQGFAMGMDYNQMVRHFREIDQRL